MRATAEAARQGDLQRALHAGLHADLHPLRGIDARAPSLNERLSAL
ncbi:MAG: hypothetical protein KatS3mg122_0067 [Caldimonas sp.]|nr:hypothetical protein [Caldimonas taiwanensis]GIX22836.1 MAG: hypothetical protein KatS3mg122_0067 [Caldimonas sp.]